MMLAARYLVYFALLLAVLAGVSLLSADGEARTATWDGGAADALATSAANWDLDTVPVAGDSVVFVGTSSTKSCSFNLALDNLASVLIDTGYTGTVTQQASIKAGGWIMKDGTLVGSATYWITISNGTFTKTGGTVSTVFLLHLDNSTVNFVQGAISRYWFSGVCAISGSGTYLDDANALRVDSGAVVTFTSTGSIELINNGVNGLTIDGQWISAGAGMLVLDSTTDKVVTINGYVSHIVMALRGTGAGASVKYTLGHSLQAAYVKIYSMSSNAAYFFTLDLNDHNLSAPTVVVGLRGILQCGAGSISTSSLDSSAGQVINETAAWKVTDNAMIKMAAGASLYAVEVNGSALRLDKNVTMASLTFIGLDSSRTHGLWMAGVRDSSIVTTADGRYLLGTGTYPAGGLYINITPIISIDPWQHTDAFRNTIWQGYDYWADHDCDLLVTWSMTASKDWLTIDDLGNITGAPDEDGTCYYTITVTHSNGETASVSGYITVETPIAQFTSDAITPLIGIFIVVIIVCSVVAMFNRFKVG